MSGEINPVSQVLGRLEAQMSSLTQKVESFAERADKRMDALTEKIDAVRADQDGLKNKGIGLLTGVAILGGGVGAALKTKLMAFFGGP